MKDPFDIEVGNVEYAIFPEEDETYTVFKNGIEYIKIQKDTEGVWLRLDPDTDITLFEDNEEVNNIGKEIVIYESQDHPEEDED